MWGVDAPIAIMHAAERYVVVDKPSGLLSVPGKGEGKRDCAVARVRAMFPSATGPLVVHRLDMETSGLLVFGLDAGAQRDLSRQFEGRAVEKSYLALVDGLVEGESGRIELPLRCDLNRRPIQIVDHERGREAVTLWRVLGRDVDRTLVEFRPLTGRSHQLRVHAAAGLGAPILGDPLYGRADSAPRLMLHAAGLSFREPGGGRRVEFESPASFGGVRVPVPAVADGSAPTNPGAP